MATVRRKYIILRLYTLRFEHIHINNKKALKMGLREWQPPPRGNVVVVLDQLTAAAAPAICWQENYIASNFPYFWLFM